MKVNKMEALQPLAELTGFKLARTAPLCDGCDARIAFKLETPSGTHFMDLLTILKCLRHVQEEDLIPDLPNKWWNDIWNEHG